MIKSGVFIFWLLFLVSPVLSAAAGESPELPEVWTAKSSVAFALANSPDSRVALQRIEVAAAAVDQARVSFYPHVDVSAQYSQTDNPIFSFGNILNHGVFSQDMDFNDPGRTDDLVMKAGVNYRFYNGGRDQAGVDAAQAGLARSRMDREAVNSRLAFEVVRSFQSLVQAHEMLEARNASLDAIRASLAVAKARFDAGDLLKVDLLNLEVQESRASENLILAEHRLELSQKIFLNLLGLKEGCVIIDPSRDCTQEIPRDQSYELRPELQSIAHAEEAAAANLQVAKGGNLPTIDGYASYQYDKGFVFDGSGDSWMAGVKVNYALFDGKRTSADVAKAKAELSTIQAQRIKTELRIDLEVKQAKLNYRQAVKRLQVTEKMVEQAVESARLSRTRFKEGVILSSDLIDVEMRLTDALVRQSVAKGNIKVATADLRRSLGLPQFEGTTEEGESK
ncbi:MAG TPA: TolC family protein [Desulfocapsa sulfexigens]|nr:TolC family protein [Desulfocapsa sulfexigens]